MKTVNKVIGLSATLAIALAVPLSAEVLRPELATSKTTNHSHEEAQMSHNQQLASAISDAHAINQAENWPKPVNPVAPGSDESPALKVVQGFFAAYGAGDMEAIKQYVAEDVEWHIPGRHRLAGTKRGITEFTEFFAKLGEAGFKAEVMMLAANEHYVIDAHRGYSTAGDSAQQNIDLNWILLYQIEDGKIKRVQNFSGNQYASDAFFDSFFAQP
ncbi:nuclear transport factor 2 family protein [Aliagarivorans marinus]|uniref:nuclear transport factor 2 family protein n=1 Tax=Aliagarivorans marinus TaxID=561965 RepID=UPI000418AACA|nr:nuclear transport factor 2 family protein [Aliagarivorans marinus]